MITRLDPRTSADEIDDLRRRIAATRWPGDVGDDWSRGTRPSALRRVLDAWAEFDWSRVERRLRDEQHLLVGDPGRRVHLWRSGTPGAPAIVLIHGWPDSFVRFRGVAEHLADLDVIVPSIPGFGFSDPAGRDEGGPRWNAERLLAALEEIGVRSFAVHGGDLGTAIADQIATLAPERVTALHLSDVPLWHTIDDDDDLSVEEKEWADAAAAWEAAEGAYAAEQRTKPQTLAAALTDSPAGLASWYLEKFQAWGEGDVFERIPLELILENLSLHWFTRTAGSAARVYFDRRRFPPTGRVSVPTAFGLFPHDLDHGVESFARRWYPTVRFTRFPSGGHFGAMEHPAMLAADLRALLENA